MIGNKPDCERCDFSTPVGDGKYFCIFSSCPYHKHPDPFGEKANAQKHLNTFTAEHQPEPQEEEKPVEQKPTITRKKKTD